MSNDTSEKRITARDLALLLGLAFLYRALFLSVCPRVLDTADAIHYVETAQHLSQGDWFACDPKIPILYPLLGAMAHFFVADMEWACRWVSFAASILFIIPAYLLAKDLHGRPAARIAALAVAIWPWLADYGCGVATEASACLWWFLGVWLMAQAMRRGGGWPWLTPWPFFALYLTRAEGMVLLLAAPMAGAWLGGGLGRSTAARRLIPYFIVVLPLVALNTIYVRMLTGRTTANYRVGFILEEFGFARFADTAAKTITDVFPVMLGPVMLLFLGAGLFLVKTERRDMRFEAYVLLFAAVQWVASLFVLSPAPRYLMAPIVLLSFWSASGMAWVSRNAQSLRGGRGLRMLPVAALVAAMGLHTVVTLGSEYAGRPPREPREYKAAGLWMREHLEPGLIFCRKPQVGFYAGMPSTGPALTDTLDQSLQRAQDAGARYVVVDERYTAQDVPALRVLLDPANAPAPLTLLQTFDLYPRCRVVIYAFPAAAPLHAEGS